MAKKTSYVLKQLVPEENSKTGTKYIVRKPSKGLKASEKLRLKKSRTLNVNLKILNKCCQKRHFN